MPEPTVTPEHIDPYKNFQFRIKWDGRYVAGVSKVSALRRSTEVVLHREGGDPGPARKLPGQTEFEAITLERGVTHDTAFQDWANKVWALPGGSGTRFPLDGFRKNVRIEIYSEAGQIVLAYNVLSCWVSEYSALAQLESASAAVLIESIRLENEGWERDPAIVTPPSV